MCSFHYVIVYSDNSESKRWGGGRRISILQKFTSMNSRTIPVNIGFNARILSATLSTGI